MINVPAEIRDIINAANELACNGNTKAPSNERIAAAFVLDDMKYIPRNLDEKEAWNILGSDWQELTRLAGTQYRDLLVC